MSVLTGGGAVLNIYDPFDRGIFCACFSGHAPDLLRMNAVAGGGWRMYQRRSANETHFGLRTFKSPVVISPIYAALLQIDHADNHRPPQVEGKITETPPSIEAARGIIERMAKNAEAADVARGPESRA